VKERSDRSRGLVIPREWDGVSGNIYGFLSSRLAFLDKTDWIRHISQSPSKRAIWIPGSQETALAIHSLAIIP
jgi:hypothetical protein